MAASAGGGWRAGQTVGTWWIWSSPAHAARSSTTCRWRFFAHAPPRRAATCWRRAVAVADRVCPAEVSALPRRCVSSSPWAKASGLGGFSPAADKRPAGAPSQSRAVATKRRNVKFFPQIICAALGWISLKVKKYFQNFYASIDNFARKNIGLPAVGSPVCCGTFRWADSRAAVSEG